MLQVSAAAMKSGSGIGQNQGPVNGHGNREDCNAATPSSDGAPSAVAAEGGADASSPSRLPAAPFGRPQERVREQAGGGSRGTHGSSSAAVGVDQKGEVPAAIPFPKPSAPSSAGSSPSNPSPDSAWPFGDGTLSSAAVDCKVESSHPKKALWSKLKNYFTRKTNPITEVFNYYRVPEDMAICVNLDAYSRFRPVYGDGECFYRSFIFSYLEQVLDRQDTHEEHCLLDTIKIVSMQHANHGWTSSRFHRSYKEMHNSLTVVACHNSFTHCWHKLKFEVLLQRNNETI
ncbi:hypothetical protein ACQ4PT_032998 [Festuca glaucescens]